MNFRLKIAELIILISQNTFFVRGKIRNLIWRSVEKIINYDTRTDPKTSRIKIKADGLPFYIYFDRRSDVKVAFGNYNKKEIDFIKDCMTTNSTFVDIGSNIGIYSINIASIYPKTDFFQILSIEANPLMIERQKENIELLNNIKKGVKNKIILVESAVSETEGELQLDLEHGYGSAAISENKTKHSITVKSNSLMNILLRNKIKNIDCLKIDIEGHEDRALIPFFKTANRSLFPLNIVMEFSSQQEWKQEGNLMNLLNSIGYETQLKTRGNICLKLKQ
tara:strand:+ start:135 stop:971 length:837 start_codon:yes stop_codon:yes gene_type:complete